MNSNKQKLMATAVSAVMGILTLEAGAQVLEEITVTARQRTESIQEIPISMTAISGEDIARLNLVTSRDLADQTPNVVMVQGNYGLAAPIISVRGVTNSNFTASSNSPVSFYADGVVLNSIYSQGFSLYDVERAELLRGPQGTLFGRNSTSGALSVHSVRPGEETSGYARATIGDDDLLRLEGAVGGTILDGVLLGRLSGVYNEQDGLVDNTALGKNEGDMDNYSLRAIFDLVAFENFDATLKVQYADSDGESIVFHNSAGDNWLTPEIERGGRDEDYEKIQMDLPERPEELEAWLTSLQMRWDISETLSLTSITGYMDQDFFETNDDDATVERILHQHTDSDYEQFSQELRLNYVTGEMDWVFGAYYIEDDSDAIGTFEQSYISNIQGFPGQYGTAGSTDSELESWAVFSHLKYSLSDQWTLSAGLRYTEDDRDVDILASGLTSIIDDDPYAFEDINNHIPLDPIFGLPTEFDRVVDSDSWDEVSGDLGLQYHVNDDVMVYGGYARGFKGGSFNTLVLAGEDVVSVDPEIVDSYEIGFKSTLMDGTLRLNGALYYYEYEDFQAFEYVTVGFQVNSVLFSIDETEAYGGELELSWLPVEKLQIDLGLGYTDTEVQEISDAPFGVAVQEGNEFRNAPEWNFNGQAYYYWLMPGGKWSLTPMTDFFFVDEYYSSFANEPESTAGDYWNVNFRLRLADANERMAATAWVENAFDEESESGRFPANVPGYGTDFATAGPGRTYGVTLEYNF